MKPNDIYNLSCRHCKFYNPEGRRGGMCSQLGVLVQGQWKSCNLATPVFENEWQIIPEIALLEKSFSLGCATPLVNLEVESNGDNYTEKKVFSEEIISPSS